MKVFIAGGTGFVGSQLIDTLCEYGHEVRLLVHKRAPLGTNTVEQVEGDVTRLESIVDAALGCDAVINIVGIIREYSSRGITFERLHVQATAHLLAATAKAGIRRYLQMSALGTRPNAVSRYHVTKYQAEELVRSSGLDVTILRPSLIYGPGDAFINMLAGQVRVAPMVMPVIGSGTYRLQPIHVSDVARCFALALDMSQTVGQCYELCGNDRMTYRELLDVITAAMGRTILFKPGIPVWLMKSVVPILQHMPQFPITMDQLQMLLEENICDGCWKKVFGFEPRDFRGGIQEYIR